MFVYLQRRLSDAITRAILSTVISAMPCKRLTRKRFLFSTSIYIHKENIRYQDTIRRASYKTILSSLHVSRTKQSGLIGRMMDLLPIPHKDLYGDTVASVLDAFDAKASLDGRRGCHDPSKRQQLPPASLDVHQ